MSSFWSTISKAWHFTISSFGLDRFFPIQKTYAISFGCWLRVTAEETKSQAASTAMQESRLDYSPLLSAKNEIRLFILHPGSGDDVVTGHLEHIRLFYDSKRFEALSYVWWEVGNTAAIKINGTSVSVTKNLEAALRQLRHQQQPRSLWVDYICIDQTNLRERSDQVASMGIIYEMASSTLIWLGEATPNTQVGMEILAYFAKAQKPHPLPVWQQHAPSIAQSGLLDVMNRSWFKRMWVVQEAGRSRFAVLICGKHQVAWKSTDITAVRKFARMIKYAELLPQWKQMGLERANMQPLLEILDLQYGNQVTKPWGDPQTPDLLDVAYQMRYKLCTDPRDKVFGVLGLVDYLWVVQDANFVPDYDMTVGQLYEALGRFI